MLRTFILSLGFIFYCSSAMAVERKFPANTIYALLTKVSYPTLTIGEIPSNWVSRLLAFAFLRNAYIQMTPATVIRDYNNHNQLQNYIYNLRNTAVAIQPDFQGKAWVIWSLTNAEAKWVINNKLNIWK